MKTTDQVLKQFEQVVKQLNQVKEKQVQRSHSSLGFSMLTYELERAITKPIGVLRNFLANRAVVAADEARKAEAAAVRITKVIWG